MAALGPMENEIKGYALKVEGQCAFSYQCMIQYGRANSRMVK